MARTPEEIVQLQLGSQALQLARLLAENESLQEKIKALEAEAKNAASKDPE